MNPYIRKTSLRAYNEITLNGSLTRRRMEVYKLLYEYGPLTSGELFSIMTGLNLGQNAIKNADRRLPELRDMGVAAEVGEKVCELSGKKVILWDVTDGLPNPLPKKKTKTEIAVEDALYRERIAIANMAIENGSFEIAYIIFARAKI